MRVLITSGGTTEPIDNVRGISNFATGSLGKKTTECFLRAGHEVVLLAGANAHVPENHVNLTIIRILGTQNLYEQMEKWVPNVDVVIHSMAVSDYRPVYMAGLESLPDQMSKMDLVHFRPEGAKKISSKSDYQVMLLEKTPKIITFVKKWNPQVLLFGFKLLVGVSEEELLTVAREKLVSNQADFILANDLENIHGQVHKALLVSKNADEKVLRLKNKSEIADMILKKSEGMN